MRYVLEEFDLLPMNRAEYSPSWTYSFIAEIYLESLDSINGLILP